MATRTTSFVEIRSIIVASIIDGTYVEGDTLPSSRGLAAELGAHCQTIAKAYKSLIGDGVVLKRAGLGMSVAPGAGAKLIELEREALAAEAKNLVERGRRLGIRVAELAVMIEQVGNGPDGAH